LEATLEIPKLLSCLTARTLHDHLMVK